MTPVAMDFYWKRSGLRWVVVSVEQDRDGWDDYKILFTCWREKTASSVCLRIFKAYGLGYDIGRSRAPLLQEPL
jgi:hypothetical protein